MQNEDISEVVNLVTESNSAQLFSSDGGELFISLSENERKKTISLKSENWKLWLLRFLRANSIRLSQYKREEVTEELCARAQEGPKRNVYVRVARKEKFIQVDLGDDTFNVVHISSTRPGFSIVQPKSAYFVRPPKLQPLPVPIAINKKKFLKLFKGFMPQMGDWDWLLVLAYILKSLNRGQGSYPILVIGGPQGSGKTVFSNRLKRIIDPAIPALFPSPENIEDLIIATKHSFCVGLDNLSFLPPKTADAICRVSTGGGIPRRKLFTDNEEILYDTHRPVIINGIDDPSNRPDFLDRCIALELETISDDTRVAETELNSQFEKNLPYLLGGIYSLLAECLSVLPTIRPQELPRMTDYALMGISLEKALRLPGGTFLDAYASNRKNQKENAFWSDGFCVSIHELLSKLSEDFIEGTAQELLERISRKRPGQVSMKLPKTPRGFAGLLKRMEPLLRTEGIKVEKPGRSSHKRTIILRREFLAPPLNPTIAEQRASSKNEINDGERYADL